MLFALVLSCVWATVVQRAEAVPPQIVKTTVSAVTGTSAMLEADVNPQGKLTGYHFEYGSEDCSGPTDSCTDIPLKDLTIPAGSSPVRVKVKVEGLSPATLYHYLVVARSPEVAEGPDRVFATAATPSDGLPDNRAYEQASPVDKNGGDAVGKVSLVKAAIDGGGITFGSTFGIPGGKGAQSLPTYLASRGTSWSTQGLLPPIDTGERANVLGWLPDFSEVFTLAVKLGVPRMRALLATPTDGGPLRTVAPYTAKAEYSYAGASADASTLFFESKTKLPPEAGKPAIPAAVEGSSNVYAWDRASGKLSLVSVLNDGASPPKGAFAGPYDWSAGTNAASLRQGGSDRGYYLQDIHAISSDGDVYFTAANTGQLYLRLNPTQPQSPLGLDGKCEDPAKACTLHVSASRKDNGEGEDGKDRAGAQPAAFLGASVDGSEAFFSSAEKLTNDANTGPEQPAPAIGLGSPTGGGIEDAAFLPENALGLAVDSEHLYWANPLTGTIGRADIDGDNADGAFITLGSTECEVEVEIKPGEFEPQKLLSTPKPRYVAVDSEYVYWTNTGALDPKTEQPLDGGGSIGRAKLNGEDPEPEWICGASNPQGIAVSPTHVYWANAARDILKQSIARAGIDGDAVEEIFFDSIGQRAPSGGVATSSTRLYFATNDDANDIGFIESIALEGGEENFIFIGDAGVRGVAVDGSHVYWATQGEDAIGRVNLDLEGSSQENEFLKPEGELNGLAVDAAHLYWSVNGESPGNPGTDLYRYEPAGETLEDLTPLVSDDGAEVQGVLGASEDGSHLYFAANGVLAAGASPGNCQPTRPHGSLGSLTGSCNVYLRQGGATTFVGRVKGGLVSTDVTNWMGTSLGAFGNGGSIRKSSFLSKDGQTLLFRSQEQLTGYDNEGVGELYRYRVGEPISCVSCPPGGGEADEGPKLVSIRFPFLSPLPGAEVSSRNMSTDGNRVFFETAEALVPADTNGQGSCLPSGSEVQSFPACLDVYEWEAPGSGSCTKGGAAYSPLNDGCLYLISTGKSPYPSLFADASASGDDVFFFTRDGLVGQDKDELQDVYDARVGGGLASQNPVAVIPCEGVEGCHGPAQTPPGEESAGSASFVGPADPLPKHKKQKAKKHKKHKKKTSHKKGKRKAHSKGKTGR